MDHSESAESNHERTFNQEGSSQNLFKEGDMEAVVTPSEDVKLSVEEEGVDVSQVEKSEETVQTAEKTTPTDTDEKKKQPKKGSPTPPSSKELQEFFKSIEDESDPDKKISMAIEKMEAYLSQSGTPQFKKFWELRRLCLDLFKLNISPAVRNVLWAKYSDLSKEARRLKEIFDEQSAFAVEQVDKAITALEEEINKYSEEFEKQHEGDVEIQSKALEEKASFYKTIQKKLNLLNAHAARVNNLRRELIRMDMRVKHKNKFFQRLSSAGDHIFPLRKELIKEVSDQFVTDIEEFITTHFNDENLKGSIFFLREEIKLLQGMAKNLTLNTHSFTTTRKRLSDCWDKLKLIDKERKKERSEKREIFQKNKSEIEPKIDDIKQKFTNDELSSGHAADLLDAIQKEMRHVELGREEVNELKSQIASVRTLIEEKRKVEEEARSKIEKEKLEKKKKHIEAIESKIESLNTSLDKMKADEVETERESIKKEIDEIAGLSAREKNELVRRIRHLRDVISTKRENEVLSLSESDQETFKSLKEILKQRKKRRKDIKEQVDRLRKASGSSGFDFEKAMQQTEQLAVEKELLDKADAGILEIEQKLVQLKRKK